MPLQPRWENDPGKLGAAPDLLCAYDVLVKSDTSYRELTITLFLCRAGTDTPYLHCWIRRIHFASVKHSQTNSLVERANHSLGEGIKARLDTRKVDLVQNNEALEINLYLLEEMREKAAIREAKSKAKMEKYYNSKVRNTIFKPGDLMYYNNDPSQVKDTGKLGPKLEGPYEVTDALGKRSI
nr:hypothetical protein [Tanacetum cinerariifolium]